MTQIPAGVPPIINPKENDGLYSKVIASNKSPQTPQAASENSPDGRARSGGAGVIAGAASSARRIVNGGIGKPYGKRAK